MHDAQKDTFRAIAAAKQMIDGRDLVADRASILVTLDHTIATLLLASTGGDIKEAIALFNEGTVIHVEERIAMYANKGDKK